MSTVLFREATSGALERNGNRWRAVLAVPGQGSSGFYSEEVLKEYGPAALAPGAKAFIGHDDERSPKDMIGVYPDGAEYVDGVGLVGELDVFPHWKEFVEAVGPHAGLSIYMMGESDSNGNVTKLLPDSRNGVDLVSYPGLEGSGLVKKMYEAAKKYSVEYGTKDDCGPGKKRVDGKCVEEELKEELPDAYRPATSDDVPEGRACGNCIFFNEERVNEEGQAWCERWEAFADGGAYCDAWEAKQQETSAPKGGKNGTAAIQPQLTKKTKGNLMEKEEFEALFASLADQVAAKVAETLAPVETDSEDVVDMAAVAEAAVKADIPASFRTEIYEAAKGMSHADAMALVESRKEIVDTLRKDLAPTATGMVAEGRVVEGGNVFSLAEITKVAK